jgi:hypothetical protein
MLVIVATVWAYIELKQYRIWPQLLMLLLCTQSHIQ